MQRLEASSGNAGAMLRGLGITENVIGGDMKVAGATDPTRADRALLINGQIRDYRMVEVPAIARFLSIALLTGLARVRCAARASAFAPSTSRRG